MKNKVYDILKFGSMVAVPAAVFIAAVITAITSGGSPSSIVLAIGEALAALLGTILTIMSKIYWKDKEIIDLTGEE